MKAKFYRKHAREVHAGASAVYALEPISIVGVVIPSRELGSKGWERSFRLACTSGIQYVIESGAEWQGVLARCKWEKVKVIGLLNKAKMAIILQNLFPVGPNGSGLNMAECVAKGVRRIVSEAFGDPGGMVASPAA